MDNNMSSRVKSKKEKRYVRLFDSIRNCMMIIIAVALFVFFSNGFKLESLSKTINFARFFSVEEYKGVLDSSFKIIDRTYDSGSENNFISYVIDLIDRFTNINPNNPIGIFSSRIPTFNSNLLNDREVDVNNEVGNNENIKEKGIEEKNKKTSKKDSSQEQKKEEKNKITYKSGDIKYSNHAGVKFNLEKLMLEGLAYSTDIHKKEILIYHTHTSEDYKDYGDYGVLQAGRYLKSYLDDIGVDVIHNATVNDSDFNSSYTKSFNTVSSVLKGNKDVKVIVDLHRDAVGKGKLSLVNEHEGKKYAQLMFVVGTDKTLDNPEWKENLKLAAMLYDEMNSICPGIMRPLYLTSRRYNQHMTNGSLLIEVGGDGNTMEECKNSMKVFAQALKNVLY